MSLSELGEFGFIDRIAADCVNDPARVIVGIGDDCAVIRAHDDRVLLVTTDLLIEGVHFLRDAITPRQLGAKALAVSLSDVAAMGGEVRDAFISLAVPAGLDLTFLDDLYAGLKTIAREHRVNILGGDTTVSRRDLVVNVLVTGDAAGDRVILRSGAKVGDRIYVTGNLGDSGAGLHAILNGHALENDAAIELVRRHHEPRPHLAEGRRIAATGQARAMIDLSDGLAADLGHVCDQSGVGCRVEAQRLPLSHELETYCTAHDLNATDLAVGGGENYVLLCTGDPELGQQPGITDIGEIVAADSRTVVTPDGAGVPLGGTGWDHFRR